MCNRRYGVSVTAFAGCPLTRIGYGPFGAVLLVFWLAGYPVNHYCLCSILRQPQPVVQLPLSIGSIPKDGRT